MCTIETEHQQQPRERAPYPFPMPKALNTFAVRPAKDGLRYLDVKIGDRWDGILVVDVEDRCIGIYEGRKVRSWPLPFEPDQIQAVRPACGKNRLLASVPQTWFMLGPYLFILVLGPPCLILGKTAHPSFAIAVGSVPVAIAGRSGFCLTGLPLLIASLVQTVAALVALLRWAVDALKALH